MKTIEDYEKEIKKLCQADPIDYEKLNRRLGKLADKLDIIIQVAQNEQKPWTESELGYPTKQMPLKAETGYDQTGDYHFEIVYPELNVLGGIIIERKTIPDLYGTLMKSDKRKRFYREIGRFTADLRHDTMIVMVEGTYLDFLAYKPKFKGKEYVANKTGASVPSRRATIASLYNRGISVQWCGTRYQAIQLYKDLIRQWCIKNFDTIIGV